MTLSLFVLTTVITMCVLVSWLASQPKDPTDDQLLRPDAPPGPRGPVGWVAPGQLDDEFNDDEIAEGVADGRLADRATAERSDGDAA